MSSNAAPSWWREAPALRFLAFFVVAWVGARVAAPFYDGQDTPAALAAAPMVEAGAKASKPFEAVIAEAGPWPSVDSAEGHVAALPDRPQPMVRADRSPVPVASKTPPTGAALAAVEPAVVAVSRQDMARQSAPEVPRSAAEAIMRDPSGRAGWSLSAWALLREKTAVPQGRIFAGELAGSQLGARLAYGFGENGAVQLYGRASVAIHQHKQSEAALGVSYRPVAQLPLDVAVERRQKIGAEGRNAMAAMLVGGVSGKDLPLDFQLDAYAQAGVVGLRSKDGFVDAALVVDRSLQGGQSAKAVRFGVMAAGAAQPQVARLDIGPRVTLPLPQVGQGMRLALDYRRRIWGDAEPRNGPALTIGVDF